MGDGEDVENSADSANVRRHATFTRQKIENVIVSNISIFDIFDIFGKLINSALRIRQKTNSSKIFREKAAEVHVFYGKNISQSVVPHTHKEPVLLIIYITGDL